MNAPMLLLVCGPSGSGKDSILDASRDALDKDPRVYFARRWVTRHDGAPREIATTATEIDRFEAEGKLACRWAAHGLEYALARTELERAPPVQMVITNVSRTTVADLHQQFNARTVLVEASIDVREARLRARGREASDPERARRLMRHVAIDPHQVHHRVRNDGVLSVSVAAFVDIVCQYLES